jgi:4-amino-4-deoxy-L-arabinose transferase
MSDASGHVSAPARLGIGRAVAWPLLAVICGASLGLKLNHLGHRSIHGLDESFHAIVARNLLKHPLVPTLYERQYLPSDEHDWQFATVWMHKPPLALWQIAGSFALLGETPLALRLPSALLATGAVWLTYLIGATLFDRRAGLIAAALHALNPATFTLVHGYIFSDHVDVAMLFWTELGVWGMGGGRVGVVLGRGARGGDRGR